MRSCASYILRVMTRRQLSVLVPAFTLIELLIVIAIIALLVGILLPSMAAARDAARRVACASNLRQVAVACTSYNGGYDGAFPAEHDRFSYQDRHGRWVTDANGTVKRVWLWQGRGFRELITPFLDGVIDAESPSILICPSDRGEDSTPQFERTSYAYSLAMYHDPANIESDAEAIIAGRFGASPEFAESPYLPGRDRRSDVVLATGRVDAADSTAQASASGIVPRAQRVAGVIFPSRKIVSGDWDAYHDPELRDRATNRAWDEKGWWDPRGERVFVFADSSVRAYHADAVNRGWDGLPNPNLTIGGVRGMDVSSGG